MLRILRSYLLELQRRIHLTVQYLLQSPQVMLHGQPMHLTDSAFLILYCLLELGDGCSQKDICKLYSISKQTINSSVKSLENKGFLTRRSGAGRDIHLFFTEFGRKFSEEHISPVFDMENATFAAMEPSECELLLSLTRKYIQILKENMKQYILEEKEI